MQNTYWHFALFTIHYSLFTDTVTASDKWQGVDESVIEKVAKEHGREAREPFINTDQGDLLFFVFLLAGTIGGFAAGYYWKELMQGIKDKKSPQRIKNMEIFSEYFKKTTCFRRLTRG